MKKLIIAFAFGGVLTSTFAQQGKLVSTYNAIDAYKKGEGLSNLESALPYINEAITNEQTMNSGKTWWYRSQVYFYLALDTEANVKYPEAGLEALACFKKMNELNDPKFKDWDEAAKNMVYLGSQLFNFGVDRYQSGKFEASSKYFAATAELNDLIIAKKETPAKGTETKVCLENAAVAAEKANLYTETAAIYGKLIASTPDVRYYLILSQLHKRFNNKEAAKQVVEEGLKKYPTDKDLLIGKVNGILEEEKFTEAIDYLNKLIALDPKNEQLYAVLGDAYNKSKDETNARAQFNTLLSINPNSFDGNFGIGALIFNKAKKITEDMNALSMSKADQLKYDQLKIQRSKIFSEAKPYLDKALSIQPDNKQVKAALLNIETLSN